MTDDVSAAPGDRARTGVDPDDLLGIDPSGAAA